MFIEVLAQVEIHTKFFSAIIFISVLSGLMDFSDIMILGIRPNGCCQKTLYVLICLYYL